MTKHVFTGKTIEEAVRSGLLELGLLEHHVNVTVLEHPTRGLLGLIGSKNAKVELEIRKAPVSKIPILETKQFLASILSSIGIVADIEYHTNEEGTIFFEMFGDDLGVVIGRRGQTLDALQLLLNVFVHKSSKDPIRIIVDAEKFRERRKKTLEDLSLRLANQVVRSRKEVVLEPMPPYERRIIHYQLQNHPKVTTIVKARSLIEELSLR
jgi:spoIIIJ-associated protein